MIRLLQNGGKEKSDKKALQEVGVSTGPKLVVIVLCYS